MEEKENSAGANPSPEEVKPVKKQKKVTKSIHDILGGDYLSKDLVVRNMPFLFYLALLAVVYIGNTYYAEKTFKKIERTKNDLKELRYQYLATKSTLMYYCRQSEISRRASKYGIKESLIPPYKIYRQDPSTGNDGDPDKEE